jgi:enoyl-[acyl-carrier-protein] reductase (NADH)
MAVKAPRCCRLNLRNLPKTFGENDHNPDIANMLAVLASDVSGAVTGQCIVVDGGQIMD